jgi:organic radical activating enzyme
MQKNGGTQLSKTFCPLPWTHLATHPHGSVTLCCESDHSNRASESRDFPKQYKTLHSEQFDFDSIFNSEYFNQVRQQMLNNEIPDACFKCFYYESIGKESKRQRESKRLDFGIENASEITNLDGSLKSLEFEFIELRLGNYCNLGCRTCNPSSSTTLKKDWKKVFGEKDLIDQKLFDWPDNEDFWESLSQHVGNLQYIYINGGEPLLIDKHKFFLEKLVRNNHARNIHLVYSTNGTVVNNKFIDVWKHFKSVDLMISVDDIEERNTYIRYPSDWKKILKFLDWIEELSQSLPITFKILQTVSAMNVYYLGEVADYFDNKNIPVSRNYVHQPKYYRPDVLPQPIKNKILEIHKDYDFYTELKQILGSENNDFDNFIKVTKEFDAVRKQSFHDTFPQLAKLIYEHQ